MEAVVFCECSERVTEALRAKGIDAWSSDLKPSEITGYKYHIQGDARNVDLTGVKLLIAHPDCTTLANSGVRWLKDNPERRIEMYKAANFFNWCLSRPVPLICVENPIQHKYARYLIEKYTQIIHPHYFGEPESKATCLWLKGLPKLIRTHFMDKSEIKQSTWREAPSDNRKANRARTFQCIANAMAEQWGILIQPEVK